MTTRRRSLGHRQVCIDAIDAGTETIYYAHNKIKSFWLNVKMLYMLVKKSKTLDPKVAVVVTMVRTTGPGTTNQFRTRKR